MSKTKLDEIMEEVIPVFNGITDELDSYELTKEQYKWFLVEASKKEELEKLVQKPEKEIVGRKNFENQRINQVNNLIERNQRYKQELKDIRTFALNYDAEEQAIQPSEIIEMINDALKGDTNA